MTSASAGGSFADEAFAVTLDAYRSAPSWELGTRAAIRCLFEFLAEHADRTEACVATAATAEPEALRRRDRLIARFAELLQPGFDRAPSGRRPPAMVGEAIGGGIYELVRSYAVELRLTDLPTAAPDATVVALAPFVGAADAAELAAPANVQVKR